MSNLIGELPVYILTSLKRGRKILKIDNCFVTQVTSTHLQIYYQ